MPARSTAAPDRPDDPEPEPDARIAELLRERFGNPAALDRERFTKADPHLRDRVGDDR